MSNVNGPDVRPHQAEALAAIREGFATATRGQAIMACGTGKTLVSAWAAQQIGARRVVFLAPSIHVASQAASDYASIGMPITAAVCSDGSALDDSLSYVPVLTDADDLAQILRGRDEWTVFATYASAGAVGDALQTLGVDADLLVCDEAHRLAGDAEKEWSGVLDDDYLAAGRRLFLTATPRVNSRGEDGAIGMENEALFGRVFHELRAGKAIERGLICDYVVKCPEVPDDLDPDDRNAVEAAVLSAVARDLKSGAIKSAFMFRRTIRRCEDTAEALEGLDAYAVVIHGGQSIRERKALLRAVVVKGGVAVTDQALGEGVDAPAMDAAVFMDTKTSVREIVQNIGRPMRLDKSNRGKVATIVVPNIGKQGEAVEVAGTLGYVIAALREHDERLEDVICALIGEAAGGRKLTEKEEAWIDEHGLKAALRGPAREAVLRDVVGSSEWGHCRKLSAWIDFAQRHGRPPSRKGGLEERELANWAINTRRLVKAAIAPIWLVNAFTSHELLGSPKPFRFGEARTSEAMRAGTAAFAQSATAATQVRLLRTLLRANTPAAVAQELSLHPSRVSCYITRAVADGLVSRVATFQGKGSCVTLSITPAGQAALAEYERDAAEGQAAK